MALARVCVNVRKDIPEVHGTVVRVIWFVRTSTVFECFKQQLELVLDTIEVDQLTHRVCELYVQLTHRHATNVCAGRVARRMEVFR